MNAPCEVLRRAIDAGAMPGAVAVVYRRGEPLLHEAFGTLDGASLATTETLYDLASLTKPLATASTLLKLVEAGEVALAQPAAEALGIDEARLPGVTLRHLLTHTSGLPAWAACYSGLDAAVETILALERVAPETRYAYSCLGYILLAKILQNLTGKSLDALACERVFAPLGLASLTFAPDPARCAPTTAREGAEEEPVSLRGIVHDGNARAIRANGGVSGNAGLFGTAGDVARFGEALRAGSFFSAPAQARLLSPQSAPPGHTLALFCTPNPLAPQGDLLSERTVGHSGYTGTLLVIDPAFDLTVALLTNAVLGEGKTDFLRWRRRFINAIAGSLPA